MENIKEEVIRERLQYFFGAKQAVHIPSAINNGQFWNGDILKINLESKSIILFDYTLKVNNFIEFKEMANVNPYVERKEEGE